MKVAQLLEASIHSNAYFTVLKPMKVWQHVGFKPTNNYYGASRLHSATYVPLELHPGDEVHLLHGGVFAVKTGASEGVMIRLTAPNADASPFERGSQEDRSRILSRLVDDGQLDQLHASSARKTQYTSP